MGARTSQCRRYPLDYHEISSRRMASTGDERLRRGREAGKLTSTSTRPPMESTPIPSRITSCFAQSAHG